MLLMVNYARSLFTFTTNVDFRRFSLSNMQSFLNQFSLTIIQVERGRMNPDHEFSEFTDFILVHNAEEAANLPDNVIAAWPDEDRVDALLAGIYWAINRPEHELPAHSGGPTPRRPVSLEDFGLTYPLTAADLVDNWRKVDELWFALTQGERNMIMSHIEHGIPLS